MNSTAGSDMAAAYDLASALRPHRRNLLLRNHIVQVMSLADGCGAAVVCDLGEERIIVFDPATGTTVDTT